MELTESTVSSKLREVYLRNRDDPDLTRRRVTQLCADELGADLSDWREFIKSTLAQIQAEEDEKESDDDCAHGNEAATDGAQAAVEEKEVAEDEEEEEDDDDDDEEEGGG